jgi:hypothetical protein
MESGDSFLARDPLYFVEPAIKVPGPDRIEELRLTSIEVVELHRALNTVVANALYFVPGESVDQLKTAWVSSGVSLLELADRLYPVDPKVQRRLETLLRPGQRLTTRDRSRFVDLAEGELSGPMGELKRSTGRRLRERWLSVWHSAPFSKSKLRKSAKTLVPYLEWAGNFVGSITGVSERVVELIKLFRQLLNARAERDKI